MTVLMRPEQRWVCPNCTVTDVTHDPEPHTRFHACRGLRGLSAPMVAAGADCVVEAVEREDYVNGDRVQTDGDGRPVMAVVTRYADGSNDTAVMAPTAMTRAES